MGKRRDGTGRRQALDKSAAQFDSVMAKTLSDELKALHTQALAQFPVWAMLWLHVSLLGVEDLGEAGGYVTPGVGIPALHSP